MMVISLELAHFEIPLSIAGTYMSCCCNKSRMVWHSGTALPRQPWNTGC